VEDKPIGASHAPDSTGAAMSRSLVLNATYEPLGVVSDRRALILVLNMRASMIESTGEVLHFASGQLELRRLFALINLSEFLIDMRYHSHAEQSLLVMEDDVSTAEHLQHLSIM
jgi:hypothetical protein